MDGIRFDAALRTLGSSATRRGLAGVVTALAAAVLPARPAAAAPCRNAADCGECQVCRGRTCRRAANGTSCGANKRCRGGACECQPGFSRCGRTCVDVQSDRRHCGACGRSCGAGETCCGGVCANLQSNVRHCGGCGSACPLNELCTAGTCQCGTMGTTAAPYTCCPAGANPTFGGKICRDAATQPYFASPECLPFGECPADGWITCIGTLRTGTLYESCRACCPPGSACDTVLGVCRYA